MKNPAGYAPAGLGKSSVSWLPDPRRRTRNDAYDYYADDDRQRCGGSAGKAEVL